MPDNRLPWSTSTQPKPISKCRPSLNSAENLPNDQQVAQLDKLRRVRSCLTAPLTERTQRAWWRQRQRRPSPDSSLPVSDALPPFVEGIQMEKLGQGLVDGQRSGGLDCVAWILAKLFMRIMQVARGDLWEQVVDKVIGVVAREEEQAHRRGRKDVS
jgi:hypothetical protein